MLCAIQFSPKPRLQNAFAELFPSVNKFCPSVRSDNIQGHSAKKFQGGQLLPTALKRVADCLSVMMCSSHYRLLLPHSRHSVESSEPTTRKNVFIGELGMVII